MAFPHSDPLVLHAMGTCEKCDQFEELQMERCELFMNFTGKNFTEGVKGEPMTPCPSEGGPTAAAKRKALEATKSKVFPDAPRIPEPPTQREKTAPVFIYQCMVHGQQIISGPFPVGENITLACAKCLAAEGASASVEYIEDTEEYQEDVADIGVDMIDGVPIERYEDLTKDVTPIDSEILEQMNGAGKSKAESKIEQAREEYCADLAQWSWEYRVELIFVDYNDSNIGEEEEIEKMNKLGKDKWELVNVIPFGPVGFRHYYRRLKDGQ